MTDDGDYMAVLDRFEEDLAVLLLEANNEVVDGLVVPKRELPEAARHQDAVLHVRIEDDQLVEAEYDPDQTTARKQATQDRFDRLADRPPKDDEG